MTFTEPRFLFEKKKYFLLNYYNILLKHFRTSHLARMMGEELQKKHSDKIITNEEILCLEVAGLCHDLGKYT